jgi:hypothetical protein
VAKSPQLSKHGPYTAQHCVLNGLVWQRHVQNITEQSSRLLILELVKSDDVI